MHPFNMITRGALGCALFVLSSTVALALQETPATQEPEAQEQPEQEQEPIEMPKVDFGRLSPEKQAQASAQEEMIALFGKVERRLRLIDSMLVNASAGEIKALEELTSSGIEDLLEEAPKAPSDEQNPAKCDNVGGRLGQSSGQGRQVVKEIDEIITIAKTLPSECKSGAPSPGEKPKPGGSPVDQPQGNRERSESPEKPKEGGEKPDGQEPSDAQKGENPKDNKSSDQDPSNKPASQTPASETGVPPQVIDQRDQWGDLPVHVRDVFRAEGGPGMPARYRDWIDAYYRRLNARSSD